MNARLAAQAAFLLLLAAVFGYASWQALGFPRLARLFPLTVGMMSLALVAWELLNVALAARRKVPSKSLPQPHEAAGSMALAATNRTIRYLLWIGGYYVAIYFFGFVIASGLFVFSFLSVEGNMRWYAAIVSTLLLLGIIMLLGQVMNLRWPAGLI